VNSQDLPFEIVKKYTFSTIIVRILRAEGEVVNKMRSRERGEVSGGYHVTKAQDQNAEIIEKVVAQLRNKEARGAVQTEPFIRQYYSQVDPEDLAERTFSNLCGAALAHLDFMGEFKSGICSKVCPL
jgi:predicted ATPase